MAMRMFYGFSKKHMFIFGPPGVGKGSYAERLAKDLSIKHISTGDEIRKILKFPKETNFSAALIKEINDVVSAGNLVSDEIVMQICKEKVQESSQGVLLDGVPRTLTQLELYDQARLPLDLVLNITLDREYLIKRLLARRVCKICGKTYNLMSLPPKKEGVCDVDGGELIKRKDDQDDIIRNRMVEYARLTEPLLEQFRERKVVFDYDAIDGFKTYDTLLSDLKARLD